MNQTIAALTQLTTPNNTSPEDNLSSAVYDQNFNNLVSASFRKISETETQFKEMINLLTQSPQFTSDPQQLLLLQSYLSEYSNHTALVSTLVRKGVSTIETLEKAQ